MSWVKVWSLKRWKENGTGIINPPEPVGEDDERNLKAAPYREQLEAQAEAQRKRVKSWSEAVGYEESQVRTLHA